jgi:regulator of cell morphogenesis and NO signaling
MELNTDIKNWPLDLLVDYVLKIYHRAARKMMPEIEDLLDRTIRKEVDSHPELKKVQELFAASVTDLDIHFQKEENVLYPFITEMFNAVTCGLHPEPIHCGTISHPISVMISDHSGETARYDEILRLTNKYTVPSDVCKEYQLLIDHLRQFHNCLLEHIYLENEIIFPRAITFEEKYIGK